MMYVRNRFLITVLGILICSTAQLQIAVPFDSPAWNFTGNFHQLTVYQGQQALMLDGARAYLPDVSFLDGIIEWDMAFTPQRGFAGIRFRMTDETNGEEFYLRPHQSGNPDANQYCPLDNGLSSWQLYHGEGYSAAITYPFHEWFHVKLVIAGDVAEVYIKDMEQPLFHISDLKQQPARGSLHLYANRTPTYFANFTYTPMDENPPQLVNKPADMPGADPAIIPSWEVSQPFAEADINDLLDLREWNREMNWKTLPTEHTGLANIAELAAFQQETANTVFVRQIMEATQPHTKVLYIGFSDRARVYLNGRLIFSGDDGFRTRDYRFLGTIGYYDTLYLPLREGKNELWIAISEDFGGWAVQGKWGSLEEEE